MPVVVLPGTLDTKGREYAYVRARLQDAGVTTLLVDFGILGDPTLVPDISAQEVARAAGVELHDLRFQREGSDTRAHALAAMEEGLVVTVSRLIAEGRCDGVLGLGGSGGSGVISGAMRAAPLGLPKLLVSTMASGDIGGYIGTRDLCVMHSVTDIAGLNRVSRLILDNAARAMVGMVAGSSSPLPSYHTKRPLVALTMFGVTTPGVMMLVERLEATGFETIVFHAVGSGGRAMEELIDQGMIDAVIDMTVSELTDHVLGGIFDAGPDRLTAAARQGIPHVVVPGAIEVLNFGPRATIPSQFDTPERPLLVHNANVCAVRIDRQESAALGTLLATRVNASRGPAAIVLPTAGLDRYDLLPDGPFVNPVANSALFDAIRATLRPDIRCVEVEANINDPGFVAAVFDAFLQIWAKE